MHRRLIEDWLGNVPLGGEVIAYVRSLGERAYLVGGTVRDVFLRRQGCDLDFAVEKEAMSLARRVADEFHGAYVPLDPQRDVARVVMCVGADRQYFDFAGVRTEDIISDLRARDYTVNAMAVRLGDGYGQVLDPTGGRTDLERQLLRIVHKGAFEDDPLRILRGIRLRQALGFTLTSDTEELARSWAHALLGVSAERIRDELARILALPGAAESLRYASGLGALTVVLPELAGSEGEVNRGIDAVAEAEGCLEAWSPDHESASPFDMDPGECSIERYSRRLMAHWSEELSTGRARRVSLLLAALLSAVPNARAAATSPARRLRFSSREQRYVAAAIRGSRWRPVWEAGGELGALAIHRYYREAGDAGVGGAIIRMAAWRSTSLTGGAAESRGEVVARVGRLVRAWFEEQDVVVEPPQLLSGRDLMHLFNLGPGRSLGRVLTRLREAQVQGLVKTREEAIACARSLVREGEPTSGDEG